jgi:hypothetical protein
VKCRECELVKVLKLFACKCSINPITNPNPVYSHSIHIKILPVFINWWKTQIYLHTTFIL